MQPQACRCGLSMLWGGNTGHFMGGFAPAWFDLGCYEKTRKYKRREWAADFQIRRELYRQLLELREDYAFAAAQEPLGFRLEDWQRYTSVQLLQMELKATATFHFNLAGTPGDTSKAVDRLILSYFDLLREVDKLIEASAQQSADFAYDKYSYLTDWSVTVDSSRSDTAIIEDFKQWLATQRKINGYGNTKALDNGVVARLYENRVLPYLDCWLWQEIGQYEEKASAYSWAQKLAVIFPSDSLSKAEAAVKTTETLRKTTHRLAMDILRRDVLPF